MDEDVDPRSAVAVEEVDLRARPLAPLWRRLVARVLDMFTTFFLTFALVVIVFVWFLDDLAEAVDPDPWGRAFVATVLYVLVATVYEVVFLWQRGQTPGKDAMNVRVVSDAGGVGLPFGVACRRSVVLALLRLVPGAFAGTLATFVVGVTCFGDHRRRALHDYVAGTWVIGHDADLDEPDDGGRSPRRNGRLVSDRSDLQRTYGVTRPWGVTERGRTRRHDDAHDRGE